jgi:micrococcal nuclease
VSQKNLYLLLAAFLTLVGYLLGEIDMTESDIVPSPSPSFSVLSVSQSESSPSAVLEKVVKVIDGDTIEITGGIKIRYIGIDTPETVDPRRPDGCFGREASEKNKEMVLGKDVRLEKDISETDKFGRLLRYVYVGDIMVNDELVKNGYAKASTYPPDVKYQKKFLEAEKFARENSLGLWGVCQN